jgi:hypothetical protein
MIHCDTSTVQEPCQTANLDNHLTIKGRIVLFLAGLGLFSGRARLGTGIASIFGMRDKNQKETTMKKMTQTQITANNRISDIDDARRILRERYEREPRCSVKHTRLFIKITALAHEREMLCAIVNA